MSGKVLPFKTDIAQGAACTRLADEIEVVIERTIRENPDMLAVTILGVLRLVEANFIERMP